MIGITALSKDRKAYEKSQKDGPLSIAGNQQYLVTDFKKAALSEYDMSLTAVKIKTKSKLKRLNRKRPR